MSKPDGTVRWQASRVDMWYVTSDMFYICKKQKLILSNIFPTDLQWPSD